MAGNLLRGVEKYAEKLALGRATRSSKVGESEQVARFGFAAARAEDIRNAARQVLCAEGVGCIQFGAYFAFTLAVDKCLRLREGETCFHEVRLVWVRWTGRGLDPRVLRRILADVFSLSEDDVDSIAVPPGV